ncbi:MAG: hypothetical protein JO333_09720, partial [Verrucomicrobia bacterium]|nr:hypothetical protein [Verrucomicrobiota bacterium]
GPLVFLAAADHVLGLQLFPQTRAQRLVDQLKEFTFPSNYAFGICQGIGALIYGCILLAKFTKQDEWSKLALDLNSRIQQVSKTSGLDLTSGTAGFLLATTRLFEATGDQKAAANAKMAARILAEHFDPGSGWRHTDGNWYLGLAHGIAGIVLALDRYRRVFSDHQYDFLIANALEIENRQFDPERLCWPVALHGQKTSMNNWCNGAAGIMICQAATKSLLTTGCLAENIANLSNKIGRRGMMDHWCCGNFGISEALAYVARECDLPHLQTDANNLIEDSLQRGLSGAFFRFQPSVGENICFSPSLFRGISGVGYSLLRFLNPGKLPYILAFEI